MTRTTGAAPLLAAHARALLGGPLPVRLRAWDGSAAGPPGAPEVQLRSPRALRRLLWHPGELGLADAYVTGELEVPGDLADGLAALWNAASDGGLHAPRPGVATHAAGAALLLRLGALGPPPAPPAGRARLRGRLHSTARDRAAIGHHYDTTADFYALLLDPSMAYSCAYWTRPEDEPEYDLAAAQRDKLALICAQLGVGPGTRLLDLGCGWGSLALYAAEECGARVTAVTLAAEQARTVRARVRERGLTERVEVRCCHYRDVDLADGGFDALASIEMGEHVGRAAYPHFARSLHRLVRPRGRVLVQQMSRGQHAPGGGPFIEQYIAPDMHMRPLGETVGLLEETGLELCATRSLREDYVRTVDAWRAALEQHWTEAVRLVGETTARVWRLYLAGGQLAFAQGRMGVDQLLAVRTATDGDSGLRGGAGVSHATDRASYSGGAASTSVRSAVAQGQGAHGEGANGTDTGASSGATPAAVPTEATAAEGTDTQVVDAPLTAAPATEPPPPPDAKPADTSRRPATGPSGRPATDR